MLRIGIIGPKDFSTNGRDASCRQNHRDPAKPKKYGIEAEFPGRPSSVWRALKGRLTTAGCFPRQPIAVNCHFRETFDISANPDACTMDHDEYFRQIARLQNAMIEGKIDRETYERFQAELKAAAGIPAEAPAGDDFLPGSDAPQKGPSAPLPADEANQLGTAKPAAESGPVEPPPENPFKRPPAGTRIERPALPPDLFDDDDFDESDIGAADEDDDETPLLPPRNEPKPGNASGGAPDISLFAVLFRQASTILEDGKAVSLTVEVATWTALVVILPKLGPGMRLPALMPELVRGAVIAAIAAGLTLVWSVAMKSAETVKLHLKNPDFAMLLRFVQGVLLVTAAVFWVMAGGYLGEQVGRIVGGRFGFPTPSAGSMGGMLVGGLQALKKFQGRNKE